jgi:hypothetical protein
MGDLWRLHVWSTARSRVQSQNYSGSQAISIVRKGCCSAEDANQPDSGRANSNTYSDRCVPRASIRPTRVMLAGNGGARLTSNQLIRVPANRKTRTPHDPCHMNMELPASSASMSSALRRHRRDLRSSFYSLTRRSLRTLPTPQTSRMAECPPQGAWESERTRLDRRRDLRWNTTSDQRLLSLSHRSKGLTSWATLKD